ncbi:RNA methyltransferase [Methylococcus sp. EFPC2]|uniref:RNA methyltransferase n=1 Tax=Methylococcus sp. EFPC2 TaxID=2812648 RepID=UPI001967ECDC|nr:RNA methyltransferase [Methylococcus sp. EFPC2]QSA96748.1 RNA methyltransferase [Methylococcus sp. EFPC2]
MLSNIRIVLVATTHPGNIGAAARAMKNMGLSDLALVTPKIFPSDEASARASGADDILESARVFDDLDAAVADCHRVIGASARLRTIAWPQLTPRESAELAMGDAGRHKTAIVFGREHAGLTNEELERCHFLLHIPCNPDFSSLNVAAAVQVITYELFQATRAGAPPNTAKEQEPLATGEQMESFHKHLVQTLFDVGFLHERKSSPSLTRKLRRIFNRALLEQSEIHMLRGILTAVQHRLGTRDVPRGS